LKDTATFSSVQWSNKTLLMDATFWNIKDMRTKCAPEQVMTT